MPVALLKELFCSYRCIWLAKESLHRWVHKASSPNSRYRTWQCMVLAWEAAVPCRWEFHKFNQVFVCQRYQPCRQSRNPRSYNAHFWGRYFTVWCRDGYRKTWRGCWTLWWYHWKYWHITLPLICFFASPLSCGDRFRRVRSPCRKICLPLIIRSKKLYISFLFLSSERSHHRELLLNADFSKFACQSAWEQHLIPISCFVFDKLSHKHPVQATEALRLSSPRAKNPQTFPSIIIAV